MTLKEQKIISASLVAIAVFGGLQVLAYIINLNQLIIFLKAAFAIYLYLALEITLLYDLHFKNPGSLARARARHEGISHWFKRDLRIIISASYDRISHLAKRHHWLSFQNYLILPGLLFWSTAAFLYLQMGSIMVQQTWIFLSSISLILYFWYLKEAFSRQIEKVDRDIFAVLSAIKIYAASITFAASLALMRRFCIDPLLYAAAVFSFTYLLVHQALFQHKAMQIKNLGWALLISFAESIAAFYIYRLWGFNYYTAGIALAALYNFMWGAFHYNLDHALTKKIFFEILLLCLIIVMMVFSVTNFRAQLLDACIF